MNHNGSEAPTMKTSTAGVPPMAEAEKPPAEHGITSHNGTVVAPEPAVSLPVGEGGGMGSASAPALGELAEEVTSSLNRSSKREVKETVAVLIGDWLLSHDRLLRDDSAEPRPYLLNDDAEAVLISEKNSLMRYTLHTTGINASEPFYLWLVHQLQAQCYAQGRKTILARYSTVRNGVLYISCGKNRFVQVFPDGEMDIRRNGSDDVVFAAESTFPAWEPAEPISLFAMAGFDPVLETPSEVPEYTKWNQLLLMEAWLIAMLMNVRPLPILTAVGQQGSGKSTTMRLLVKLLMGSSGDLAGVPAQQKDFNVCATNLPIYAIDNFDRPTKEVAWITDALATAVTGGTNIARQLWTDDTLFQKQMTAAMVVTTRTALFAQHTDIAERVLPLFFGTLERYTDEKELYQEIADNRNGLLTGLARQAATLIFPRADNRSLPSRFPAFAKISAREATGDDGIKALTAWVQAQRFALAEQDPLAEAIMNYENPMFPLMGTASEIVKILENHGGASLPLLGGGKAISLKLKELTPLLANVGIKVQAGVKKERAYFHIRKESMERTDDNLHGNSALQSERSEKSESTALSMQEGAF